MTWPAVLYLVLLIPAGVVLAGLVLASPRGRR